MRPSTKLNILSYLSKNSKAKVEDLRRELNVSRQIIHRNLNILLKEGKIIKIGKAPIVFYSLKNRNNESLENIKIADDVKKFIDNYYLYVSPSGNISEGFEGFKTWADSTNQTKNIDSLLKAYIKTRKEANTYFNKKGLIEASNKLKKTFGKSYLNKIYYLDFFSIPQFGKTKLGQQVLYAKQSQKENLIKNVAQTLKPKAEVIIKMHAIDAYAIIPPSVPRNVQFLKELEKYLNLNLARVELVKAYPGEIPIPQKTLSKLQERIQNAKETIHIKNSNQHFKNILIIDDAVGSGASLNETAKKFKEENVAKKVYGVAIVGSYKGFDVISEI